MSKNSIHIMRVNIINQHYDVHSLVHCDKSMNDTQKYCFNVGPTLKQHCVDSSVSYAHVLVEHAGAG